MIKKGFITLPPQITNSNFNSFYENTSGWTKISGYYTPTVQGVRYIMIGNFDPGMRTSPKAPSLKISPSGCAETNEDCYISSIYYLDDVVIEACTSSASIAGPNYTCSGSNSTFTLQNAPSNTTITWSTIPSGAFSPANGSGSSFTAQPLTSTSGYVDLIATVGAGCQVIKRVWTKPNAPISIYGDQGNACPGQIMQLFVSDFNNDPSITSYQWVIQGAQVLGYGGSKNEEVTIKANNSPGTYLTFSVRAYSPNCGYGPYLTKYGYVQDCGGGGGGATFVVASPNPSSDYLDVTFVSEDTESNMKHENGFESEVFLINQFSKVFSSQKSNSRVVKINTSNIPEGLYILHVKFKDGIIRKRIEIKR